VVFKAVIQEQGQSVEGNQLPLSYHPSELFTKLGCADNLLVVLASSAKYLSRSVLPSSFKGHMDVKGGWEQLSQQSMVVCLF